MSTIYHCKISVYTDDDSDNDTSYAADSEVFADIDEAKAWGIKGIDKRVQRLVDKIVPADYDEKEICGWIDEWNINFDIIEFDPARKKEIDEMTAHILAHGKTGGAQKDRKYYGDMRYDALHKTYYYKKGAPLPPYLRTDPYEVHWSFDRHGNLLDRYYWLDETFLYRHFPGDDNPKAGTKFKHGDYVTSSVGDCKAGTVYVVSGTPFPERTMSWTNRYDLWGIHYGEFIPFLDSGAGFGVHETQLKLYKGKISEDNPLYFLRMIAAGEIELTDKEWNELTNGRIALNENISWREILPQIGGSK